MPEYWTGRAERKMREQMAITPLVLTKKPLKRSCVVCLFGVIPRSITKTWVSMQKNLLLPLSTKFNIDICIFNLNVGNTPVDGVILDQNDINIIPYTIYFEEMQENVDKIIDKKCKEQCVFLFPYGPVTVRNAMRQLYSENKIGLFLSSRNFDLAVVCGPDYFIAQPLNMDHVEASLKNGNVYTSQFNDSGGYTNGFYFGRSSLVASIMKRFDNFESGDYDYEQGVKKAFESHGILRVPTDMVFWKIRANGHKDWQGGRRTDFVSKDTAKRIRALFSDT